MVLDYLPCHIIIIIIIIIILMWLDIVNRNALWAIKIVNFYFILYNLIVEEGPTYLQSWPTSIVNHSQKKKKKKLAL